MEPDGDGEKEPSTFDIEAELLLLLLPITGEDDDEVVISSSKIPSRIDSRVKGIILALVRRKRVCVLPNNMTHRRSRNFTTKTSTVSSLQSQDLD